jgi:hypothetical protein
MTASRSRPVPIDCRTTHDADPMATTKRTLAVGWVVMGATLGIAGDLLGIYELVSGGARARVRPVGDAGKALRAAICAAPAADEGDE